MTAPVPAHRHPGRSKRHLRRTRAPTGSKDDSGRHHWHGAVRGNSPELFNPPYLPASTLRPTSKVADLLSITDAAIECYARIVIRVCKVYRVCRRVKYCAKVGALGSGSWNQVASGCHSPSPPPPLPPPSNCIQLMATSAHGAIFLACKLAPPLLSLPNQSE